MPDSESNMADNGNLSQKADNESKKADNKSKKAADKMAAEGEDGETLVAPPDGGYGWVIVFAAFVCNMITDGIAFSFGVLYDDLLEDFGESKSKTSWVGSIFMGVPLLASPIASALINKYGCRTVSIVGGLLGTAGFLLSYFATSVEFLCFSFGFVSGIGLAMVYTPAVVIVAFYFEKKRALATGLSVAGSGIGTLAFAPFVEFLTNTYGWRGTLLILSGVMLNICVFGALFRPLTAPADKKRKILDQRTVDTVAVFDSDTCSSQIAKMRELYSDPCSHSLIQFPTYLSQKDAGNGNHGDKSQKRRKTVAMVTMATSIKELNRSESEGQLNETTEKKENSLYSDRLSNGGSIHSNRENQGMSSFNGTPSITINGGPSCSCNEEEKQQDHITYSPELRHRNGESHHSNALSNGKLRSPTNASEISRMSGTDRLHPLYRRDIFYKGSLLWLPQTKNPARVASCPDLYMMSEVSDDDDDSETQFCQWKHVKRVVKEMLDVSIFKQPLYLLFFISNFLLYMWYDIPYFYLPNSASDNGLGEDQASWIISVIGIGNTIGQVTFGVIADIPRFNQSFVYGFGILLCGVSVMFIPVCTNLAGLSVVGSLFGLFIGANYALCSIIIVDLLSLEKLTNAYGIMLCGQGVANLIGPPLGGLLSDLTKTYVATYICAGAFIVLSGFIMIVVAVHQIRTPTTPADPEIMAPLSPVRTSSNPGDPEIMTPLSPIRTSSDPGDPEIMTPLSPVRTSSDPGDPEIMTPLSSTN